MGLNIEVSFDQLLEVLLQLPPEEKLLLATRLRASAAAEEWQFLSKELPDTSQISMEEIVAEVKSVRKQRHQAMK
jgi:hypothetical protein